MSKQLYFKQFRTQFWSIQPTGPNQVLPTQARVVLGAMTMKGYSAFLKVPQLLECHYQIA